MCDIKISQHYPNFIWRPLPRTNFAKFFVAAGSPSERPIRPRLPQQFFKVLLYT